MIRNVSQEVYRRDCVNFVMLVNDRCPHSKSGYCINCNEFVPKRAKKIDRQIDVNIYFMNIVSELADVIIDEAFDFCYQKFRQYPNITTIKAMRDKFKFTRR